ncbi:MAG: flippase [Acidobacteriia bacterium]|nr:flippase [Terriglobia bacterium]
MATSQVPETQSFVPGAASEAVAAIDAAASKQRDVNKLAAGAGMALGGRLLGRGLLLGVDVALARLLGPVQYGLYVIGWTVTRLVSLLAPLGLNSGVIRFGARYWRRDDERFKGVLWFCLLVSGFIALVLGGVFFALAPWLAGQVFHKPDLATPFRWFACGFPMAAIVTVSAAATRITHRVKYGVLTEDLSQPAVALLFIFVLVAGMKQGLSGALVAYLVSFTVAMLTGVYFVVRLFPVTVSRQVVANFPGRDLIAFSVPASFTNVLGVMILWVNRLFVGYFRPAGDVGIYQAASQVPVTVALVVGAVAAIFSPMTADFAHRGQMAQVHEIYKIGTKWTLYASIPPLLIMCLVPREVITVLFGVSYADGGRALQILALGQLFNAASGCVGTLLVMTGHQKITSALYAIMFVMNGVLSMLFIPHWGVSGAAWATTLTAAGLFIPALVIAWSRLRMMPYDRRYWKLLLATLLAGAAMLIPVPGLHPLGRLLLSGALATAIFWATIFISGLDEEDRHFVTLLRARVKF